MRTVLRALAAASVMLSASTASAFCGFYVSGADAALYNNATEVVLMRDGTRTVLSMENNYEGPAQDFAMVVPVPVVLQKENVKTLPQAVFDRVDRLAAPRLVEYWEQDPCHPVYREEIGVAYADVLVSSDSEVRPAPHYGVKVEAKFSVGEYDILILSAEDSMGLDAFLRANHYKIPAGAEAYLRPYVTNGSKFFVAKVDVAKVKRTPDGRAMLSPLRFHYDSDSFSLPIRLGLINANEAQDLIIHVIARSRYEVANYENYAIPTNVDVTEDTKESFGAFYAALFDRMTALHPKAVITEYSWSAGSCDPCPGPDAALTVEELTTLGADALPVLDSFTGSGEMPPDIAGQMTLTRMHVRYQRGSLGDDLVFRAAQPIEGGRGYPGPKGELESGVKASSYANNFQGRYVIKHPWTGPVECENPRRGVWGGPSGATDVPTSMKVATDSAFAPRGKVNLGSMLASPVPELDGPGDPLPRGPFTPPQWPDAIRAHGCAGCSLTEPGGALSAGLLSLSAVALAWGRRRRRGERG